MKQTMTATVTMKCNAWAVAAVLLAGSWLLPAPPAEAQIGGMTCLECHGNPVVGGFHGGFRRLGGLADTDLEAVCLSCHDGSYINPQGVPAPEAAVHQNSNPGQGRDEYGDFKASCLDCHNNHSPLLAGDGTTSVVAIGSPPDALLDEAHDVQPTTDSFLLDEKSVILSGAHPIEIVDATGTVTYVEGVDYTVDTIGSDPRRIVIAPGGAIRAAAPLTVFAHNYEFATNQQLLGTQVVERNSTDGLARIRRPIIVDPNGDDNGGGNSRFEDDYQDGWACSSGIPDDPACLADDVREVVFHEQVTENGTNWVPTIVSFSPVNTTGPRNGACNSCHTRASHHRRNDLGEYGGGDDHEHNIDKPCDQCHNHKDGWVNKGG